ncbi:uncharacterized protein LOC121241491 [Juglans microcarpa x Juglans regia]|uniref:uncharacterized protein LOC121241491 n=1 Tax=Juglans microcarpa x Juglans regia TaxID=2249226 RepID=UPI001B7F40D9|nr:uncharacterized protein LOC121241491 [Juglans microcarpa x Juglans regia]
MGILMDLIPIVVIWRVWQRRCIARMEGKQETVQQVWSSIKYWIKVLEAEISKVKRLPERDLQFLHRLDIPIVDSRPSKAFVVRWLRPSFGKLKLNLDGSSFENPRLAREVGILQNHEGRFGFAFSKFFGSCTNNEAEFRAIVEGIKFCR